MSAKKLYLGDGVYIDYDGFGLVLTTEDGYSATNTIYLEPEVWLALKEYGVAVWEEALQVAMKDYAEVVNPPEKEGSK